jgi:DNA (cytosine-5)-methyltransferase 1
LTKHGAGGNQRMPDKDNFGAVLQPVPYDLYQITAPINRQNRQPGDPCHTLARDNAAHAAIAIQGNLVGRDTGGPHGVGASEEGAMYTLTKADTHAVAVQLAGDRSDPTVSISDVAFCLPANSMSDRGQAVAFHPTQDPISSADGSTHCMGTGTKQGHATIAVAFNAYQRTEGQAAWPLGASDGRKVEVGVRHAMTVRRLTPRECERLQGFPDDYTAIPWRGKAETPDGPRYKALGNSMAVNCMEWIGERIAAQEVAR